MVARRSECDLLVIGAGPGGYTAAIRAGQLGLDVVLAGGEALGGTCLNHGCIPSKAYLTVAEQIEELADADDRGVFAEPYLDFETFNEWKDGVVNRLTNGVEQLCRANDVEIVGGEARFTDEHTAQIEGDETVECEFDSAIVATGSVPITPPGFDLDSETVLSARDVLELTAVPERLLVVGAGYIGMELTTAFTRFGSEVTVLEQLNKPLPQYDEDLSAPVTSQLEALGVDFHCDRRAESWERDGEDVVVRTTDSSGAEQSFACDKILVAVGRRPLTGTLSLDSLDLATDDRGFIPTNDQCQTELDHIYAIGDVAGEPLLAHKAGHEGVIAAEAIAGEPVEATDRDVPAAVFTEPEIATVGHSPDSARDAGYTPVVGECPFRSSGRAMSLGHTEGFVRLVGAEETNEMLGGQIVGPNASELIGTVTLAVETGLTLDDLARSIQPHPTLSETLKEAAASALGEAIHTSN